MARPKRQRKASPTHSKQPRGIVRESDDRFSDLPAGRAWKEWVKTLSPEERAKLKSSGVNLDEPTRDIRLDVKDGTLDRTTTTGKFVNIESNDSANPDEPDSSTYDREAVLEILRRFITVFDIFPYDRSISLFGKVLSIAVGLPDAPTAKEVAEKYGRTKQAISKRVGAVAAHLNLPPSFRMISSPENLERVRQQLRREQRERKERERIKLAKKSAKTKPDDHTLELFLDRIERETRNPLLDL